MTDKYEIGYNNDSLFIDNDANESITMSVIRTTITLPNLSQLQKANQKKRLFNVMFQNTLSFSGLVIGYMSVVFESGLFKKIEGKTYHLGMDILSYFQYVLGVVVGIVISHFALSKYGRRPTFLVNEFFMIICVSQFTIVDYKDSKTYFQIVRSLVGISIGLCCHITLVIIQELIPRKLLPKTAVLLALYSTIGTLIPCIMPLLVDFDDKGKSMLGPALAFYWPFSFIIQRIILWLFVFKFDTPKYYMEKYGTAESFTKVTNVLQKFYCKETYKDVHVYLMSEFVLADAQKYRFLNAFKHKFGKRTIAGCLLMFSHTLISANSSQDFITVTTFKFLSKEHGVNVTEEILKLLMFLIGTVLCYFFMKKFGRRTTLQYSYFIVIVVLYVVSWDVQQGASQSPSLFMKHIDWLTTPAITFAFHIGIGGGLYLMIIEILPHKYITIVLIVEWLSKLFLRFIYYYLKFIMKIMYPESVFLQWKNTSMILLIFTLCCTIVSWIGMKFLIVETKGKNEEQISTSYSDLKKNFYD